MNFEKVYKKFNESSNHEENEDFQDFHSWDEEDYDFDDGDASHVSFDDLQLNNKSPEEVAEKIWKKAKNEIDFQEIFEDASSCPEDCGENILNNFIQEEYMEGEMSEDYLDYLNDNFNTISNIFQKKLENIYKDNEYKYEIGE